jgi:FAD/FMN-containing dehydrogenase
VPDRSLARGLARLASLADAVGTTGEVTITGSGTRGGPVAGVRVVSPPAGIDWVQPAEMTVSCGAGTPVEELDVALAEHGQRVALPAGGTVGGALAVGRSGIRRLGDGPSRDGVLQVRYVSAAGEVVKAGGPTVKNVSGFDLCRLLVGSRGTLGFLGDVILRTRPRARRSQWFVGDVDPAATAARLYRPTSVLWDGTSTWVLLEGEERDVEEQAAGLGLAETDGPPVLPVGGRWSVPPGEIATLTGTFVAEVGVGVVHHAEPAPPRPVDPTIVELHRRIKDRFDPEHRLNPGVDALDG